LKKHSTKNKILKTGFILETTAIEETINALENKTTIMRDKNINN
jgi:hypothetical protein